MTRQKHASGLLAAIACMTALLSACSSGQASGGVASLPGTASWAASGPSQAQQSGDLVSFARCMRSHGIGLGPQQGKPYGIPTGSDAATTGAMRACGHLLPPVETGTGGSGTSRVAAEMPALISYARCMRGRDIAMLDPPHPARSTWGRSPASPMTSAGTHRSSAPRTRLRHLLPAGVHDDGTGP